MSVDLDTLFRKQSKARTVAERLLSGKPQSRQELVAGLELSMTTVPRVVEALESAGVVVERTTDRTRQAVYRVVGTPVSSVVDDTAGSVHTRFVHSAGEPIPVKIIKVEAVGEFLCIEWDWVGKGTYSGRLIDGGDGAVSIPSTLLTGNAEVVAVCMMSSGQLGFRIGDARSSVLVVDIRPITAPALVG